MLTPIAALTAGVSKVPVGSYQMVIFFMCSPNERSLKLFPSLFFSSFVSTSNRQFCFSFYFEEQNNNVW